MCERNGRGEREAVRDKREKIAFFHERVTGVRGGERGCERRKVRSVSFCQTCVTVIDVRRERR